MGETSCVIGADWLTACRNAATALKAMLSERATIEQRAPETGTRGEGGDRTLEIDAVAEEIVFAELERLHGEGLRFLAISEERGEVDFGAGHRDDALRVVIDPLDGSLNAKRRLTHYALSLAVATGPTVADVVFGYVYDLQPGEEWWAERGVGAYLNDARLDPAQGEIRVRDGRLELVALEADDRGWSSGSLQALTRAAYRLRSLGAIAPALCQVAAARLDGLVALRRCRAVDIAAATLIVREAGGCVSLPACEDRLSAPLDLVARSPVIAARSAKALEELEDVWQPR